MLDALRQDARFAARLVTRTPWISLTIVLTLTVGIALNVSVFTLLNAVLLRPWVQTSPETFVSVIPRFSGKYDLRYSDYGSLSQPDYVRLRDSAQSLEGLAAYRQLSVTLSGAESGSNPWRPRLVQPLRRDQAGTADRRTLPGGRRVREA